MTFQKGNKIGHRFTVDNQPDGRGRKPGLRSIPKNARDKVYAALYHAITLPDQKTAAEYLNKTAEELPEFGYLIQVYAKGMMSKNAGMYTADILDRLFGKARQTTDLNLGAQQGTSIEIKVGDPAAAAGLQKAIDTGAQPAPPENENAEDV